MPEPARQNGPRPRHFHGATSAKADFLLTSSNDGWFSNDKTASAARQQLGQDLPDPRRSKTASPSHAPSTRENSGFIDSNGRIISLVRDARGTSSVPSARSPSSSPSTPAPRSSPNRRSLPVVCGILSTLLVGWTFARPRRGLRAPEPLPTPNESD